MMTDKRQRGFKHRYSDKSQVSKDFHKWYIKTYGEPKLCRNSRYYELKKAWKSSKEYYNNYDEDIKNTELSKIIKVKD